MKKTMKVELANENFERDGFFYTNISLPAKDYEIKDAYHRARIPHRNEYQEKTVYECPLLPELEHMRLDSPTLEELNFLAKRLAALSEDEQIVLQAVKGKVFDDKEDQLISIKDVINLTYGLDEVFVLSPVETDEEPGQFVINHGLNEEVAAIAYTSRDLLDKAKIGQRQREKEGGVFIDGNYVATGSYELSQIYNGKKLPEKETSTDWVFRVKIGKPTIEDLSEIETFAWLALPANKAEIDRITQKLGIDSLEDCVYLGLDSTIPQIDMSHFEDMQDFDNFNTLAQEIKRMDALDQMKFKAVLTAEETYLPDTLVSISKNLQEYEFAPYLENDGEYFVDYINRHLKKPFDISWLQSQNFNNEGEELCARLGVTRTPYGYLSGRWQSLYEYVARHKSGIDPNEKFDLIELCGKKALFTNGRIRQEDVPQGLYKFDLREGVNIPFGSVEYHVIVNHAGTVLVKEDLMFCGEDCIVFTEETSPNFLGEEMTLQTFMETDFTQDEEQDMGGIKQ